MKKITIFLFLLLIISNAFALNSIKVAEELGEIAKELANKEKREIGETFGGSREVLRKIINPKVGWQAHHIIPVELANHRVLKKIGFNFDTIENGISLPSKQGIDPLLPIHAGSHPNYTNSIIRELDSIPENIGVKDTEKMVNSVVSKYRNMLETGTPLHNKYGGPSAWK